MEIAISRARDKYAIRTDTHGGLPETEGYTPEDLAATIFHCLGIGPDREFHDAAGRPYRIYRGTPIRALL